MDTSRFWCHSLANNIYIFSVQTGLSFVIIISFIYDLYYVMFKNTVFKIKNCVLVTPKKLRSILLLAFYILLYLIAGVVSWVIFAKPANPVWYIEFGYFTIMFCFALLPLFLMRSFVGISLYLQDGTIPSLQYIFQATSGRSYIAIVGFLLLILTGTIFFAHTDIYLRHLYLKYDYFAVAVAGEFICYLAILGIFSLLLCFSRAQHELLDEEKSAAAGEQSADDAD